MRDQKGKGEGQAILRYDYDYEQEKPMVCVDTEANEEEDGQMLSEGDRDNDDKPSVLESIVGVCYGVPYRPSVVKY